MRWMLEDLRIESSDVDAELPHCAIAMDHPTGRPPNGVVSPTLESISECCGPRTAAVHHHQWNLLYLGRHASLPLTTFDQLPPQQRYNPFIHSGYRAYYTTSMTLKSLFGWHNESINIFTHLLGFFTFMILTAFIFTTALNQHISAPGLALSRPVYGIFCGGCMVCMLLSTMYHLFTGHCSHSVMTTMGRLDFLGITVLIVVSYMPPLYVMLQCWPTLRAMYFSALGCLTLAGLIGPWTHAFHELVWVRATVFVGMAIVGVAPAVHVLLLMPILHSTTSIVVGIVWMAVLYLLGLFFYATQLPESAFPGMFDTLLSSHQIWHVCVLCAALVHFCNCVSMYQLWSVSDGVC